MKASAAGKAKHSIVVRSRGNWLAAARAGPRQAATAGTDAVMFNLQVDFTCINPKFISCFRLQADYMIKILGLDICADTPIGT